MAGLALRPASGGIGGHPHRPRRGRGLAVCWARAGAVGRSESLRPGSPRIPRLLGPGCHVVGHGATGRAGRTREGRRGRVAARDALRPSALSERSASFVRNRGVPGGEVVLCFLGVLPGVVSSTLGYPPRSGAWRSLVSAPVWGTGGPEFESRRPDSSRSTRPQVRPPSGVSGSASGCCGAPGRRP